MVKIAEMYSLRNKKGEIGIEIEMEGMDLAVPEGGYWNGVGDGSLRGESLEYVLRNPIGRDEVSKALSELETLLTHSELHPSGRCGVHIHFNVQQYGFKDVITFAVLYLIFEELLVKWCGQHREGNLFCLRAKDAEYLIYALIEAVKTGNFNIIANDNFRYASVNFAAIPKYGSLEFRSMNTPKDFQNIVTWVQLLLRVKDTAKEFNDPRALVEATSMQGTVPFARAVFGDMLDVLECPNMDRIIMDGVRRVQDIVYTPMKEPEPRSKKSKDTFIIDDPVAGLQEGAGVIMDRARQAPAAPRPRRPNFREWTDVERAYVAYITAIIPGNNLFTFMENGDLLHNMYRGRDFANQAHAAAIEEYNNRVIRIYQEEGLI